MKIEKAHAQITDESSSAVRRYQRVVVGSDSTLFLVQYELLTGLLGGFPGALGLFLRQKLYPSLLAACGKGTVFGAGLTLRHPRRIRLGRRVVISDGCVLDARGDRDAGITIGDNVVLGANTRIVCKDGHVSIGSGTGIGSGSSISAIAGNVADIGKDCLIAPFSYIGGVSYNFDRTDIPIAQQGHAPKGGVRVGDNVWLGTRATLLDGSTVGRDAIIAAGAIVTGEVPSFGIAMGVPARVVRLRTQPSQAGEGAEPELIQLGG